MDDFLDQMLSAPQWVDANGVSRPWGDASSAGAMSIGSIGGMDLLPKLPATENTMPLMHPGLSGLVNRSPPQDDDEDNPGMGSQNHHNSHLSYQRMMKLNSSSLLGSGGFEGPGMPIPPLPFISSTWQQQYVGGGGVVPPTPLISDTLVKRSHDEETVSAVNLDPGHGIPPQGLQSGKSITSQNPLHQSPGTDGTVNGSARPRVRARRGQATDPHSIAERNRRERIAERMKALQELVPDANKTDKASMLDEIIAYVRFLQMQVKCLSVCRLGGAATTPLLVDVPGEGGGGEFMASSILQSNGGLGSSQNSGVAYAERQVERLMDEDMSVAMQYLQRKGLCLMPISLATAISSITATPQTDPLPQASTKSTDKEPLGNTIASAIPSDGPNKQGGGGSLGSLKDVQRDLGSNATETSELSVGNNGA